MLSPASVVQSLASDSTPPAPVSGVPHPHGVGPVARRTAALAARDGLFLHHREHRVELHASFTDDPAEAVPLEWADGRLLGPPHAHEALERLTGAFDPQAPALAAVAELSRGLVGFCWKPEASPLHLACAARLAWLLPRVIEHGLGHVGVARCAAHEVEPRGGCPSCERLAGVRPPDAHDEALVAEVLRFVEAELAAITRTRRTGVPQGPRLGTYDPVAASLAWAATHRERLASASFQRLGWMFVPDGGHVGTLDALEARVLAVLRAIALGEPLSPLSPGPEAGRDRWIRQDLAGRLLTVHAQTEGPAADALVRLVEQLDFLLPLPSLLQGYIALEAEYVLPWSGDVFAVGYPLPLGFGRSDAQLAAGVRTACPLTAEVLERAGVDVGTLPDAPERAGIGDRFAAWVGEHHPALGPLATFESAVRAVSSDPVRDGLGPDGAGELVPCEGIRVLRADHDVLALADALEAGEVEGVLVDGEVLLNPTPLMEDWALVVGRHTADTLLVAVEPADADALLEGRTPRAAAELAAYGVMKPARYPG